MNFEVILSDKAENDIRRISESGDKQSLKKIFDLIQELKRHPRTGTGKPERLKYYKIPTYSRRISKKHRLVYQIKNDVVIVLVLSAYGHYEDK